MLTRRMLLCGVAALALFALAVTAGKPPPPPPPSNPDPAILYGPTNSEIWVMNADGSNRTAIITSAHGFYDIDPWLRWSGDNTRFVFVGRRGGGQFKDLYVSDIDGSNVTEIIDGDLSTSPYLMMYPDWSPAPLPGQNAGDEWIIFQARIPPPHPPGEVHTDLYAIRSDGTGLAQLTDTPDRSERAPCVSPDGKFVVFERHSYIQGDLVRVYKGILGTGTTGLPVITEDDEECLTDLPGTTLASRNCFGPVIDPTGTYVLVRTGSPNNYRWLVPLLNPAGAWRTPLPAARGDIHSWLDPETVVYAFRDSSQKNFVVKADVSTGAETIIASFGKTGTGTPAARRWHAGP